MRRWLSTAARQHEIDRAITEVLASAEARRPTMSVAQSASYRVLSSKRRRCAYHFRSMPRSMLVRFVRGTDSTTGEYTVVPDTQLRLPGRGTWLLACRGTIVDAAASKRLQHAVVGGAARNQPPLDGEALANTIEADLRARFWEVLSRADEEGYVSRGVSAPLDAPNLLIGPRAATTDALHALRAAAERGAPAQRVAVLPGRAVWSSSDVALRGAFDEETALGVRGDAAPLLYMFAMQLVGLAERCAISFTDLISFFLRTCLTI